MCKCIFLGIILFLSFGIFGQTKLIIIGTVHSETEKINSSVLLSELKKNKPDLLLLELDNSLMNEKGDFLNYFSSVENEAASQLAEDQSTILRPFDFQGRNKYYQEHQTFKNEALFFRTLDSCYQLHLLNSNENSIYLDYLKLNTSLQQLQQGELKEINSVATQQLIQQRQLMLYQGLLKICYSNQFLNRHKQFWKQNGEFWSFRNNEMVSNIIKYCNDYKNKKIIVLTGFYHKYYLTQELKKKEKEFNFVLSDCWDL